MTTSPDFTAPTTPRPTDTKPGFGIAGIPDIQWSIPMDTAIFDLFEMGSGPAGPGTGPRVADAGGPGAAGPGEAGVVPPEPSLSELLGVAELGDEACLELMQKAAWSIARWHGVMARAMVRFTRLRPPEPGEDRDGDDYSRYAADEVAAVLAISPESASDQVDLAVTLAGRLPATLAALERGQIDFNRARAMAKVTEVLTDAQAAEVEGKVLAGGRRDSHTAFQKAIRRAVLKVDPEGAEARREQAKAGRYVEVKPRDDGVAKLELVTGAELTEAIFQRLTALAREIMPGDGRTLMQRRVDVATSLLLGAQSGGRPPVEVHVTVPVTTLLGLQDNPGELEGYGPIPAGMARELAEHAHWRRIITDPVDGTVLDVGRRRFATAGLARHVRERDRTCRFPGCPRPARDCDLDHTQRHTDHGRTADFNIELLCEHHHQMKDGAYTGWSLTQPAPGHLEWTSPTGEVYRVGPTPADYFPPHAPADTNIDPDGGTTRTRRSRTAGTPAPGTDTDAGDDPWDLPPVGSPPPF
jgi:hypothetical protein